jgi:hypothetical protein
MTPHAATQENRLSLANDRIGLGTSDRAGRGTRRLITWCKWGEAGAVCVYPRADPREPFPKIDDGSGDRTAGEACTELLKSYQSVQMAPGCLDRKDPVTNPLRLGHGGLGGNEWLENPLVQT